MTCFAIIPARGGSKGIPGKNLKKIAGRSLLQRAIEAARNAQHVHAVYVTSDAEDILAEARRHGAIPIVRPADLASDTASSEAALLHAVDVLREAGQEPDMIAFIQCTSPFLMAEDVDGLISKMISEQADCGLTVADFPGFLWLPDEAGGVVPLGHELSFRPRRQERPAQYLENGAVYVMKTDGFEVARHRFFGNVVAYRMPPERQLEIDEPLDLQLAHILAREQPVAAAMKTIDPLEAVIFDFDGVMTDDTAIVDENGLEAVRVSRSDGMGIERLRAQGVKLVVMSKEQNPVVARRCEKLKIECYHGIERKAELLQKWSAEKDISLSSCVYIGNDLNDLEAIDLVGYSACPADAHAAVRARVDLVLQKKGGEGAVRELAEHLLAILI